MITNTSVSADSSNKDLSRRKASTDMFVRILVRLNVLVIITLVTNVIAVVFIAVDIFCDSSFTKNILNIGHNLDVLTNTVCLFLQFNVFDVWYYRLFAKFDNFLQITYKNSKYTMQESQLQVKRVTTIDESPRI